MKEESKQESPIYLSVKRLEKVIELVSSRSMTSVNPEYFITYNFSGSDASLAVASLRFLGLINKDSVSTEFMAKMSYKGEKKIEALNEIIKKAYSRLFEVLPNAENSPKDDLHNEFMHIYQISGRVASSSVPAFIYLCELSGLREKDKPTTSKKIVSLSGSKPAKKILIKNKPSNFAEKDFNQTAIPFINGEIKLILPVDVLTDIQLFDDYKKLISCITLFGEEYLKSKNKKDELANE